MSRLATALIAGLAVIAVAAAPASAKKQKTTIVGTVVALSGDSGFDSKHDDFDILREAVLATGLDKRLGGKKQSTVFAPTDQAFLDLTKAGSEKEAFEAAAALGLGKVEKVLKYHVVAGRLAAKEVVKAKRIRTLAKKSITKERGSTTLTDATGRDVEIAAADAAKVSNGIVHVVSSVLLPAAL